MNKILESRKFDSSAIRIETVGIILNLDEYKNYDEIREIFKGLGIHQNKIKFITYMSENGTKLNRWDSYFESKDFGWNGVIKNLDFIEFIDTDFDILISYYRNDNLELNFATVCSKAKFKIGISKINQNINDFTIDISTNFIEIFAKELRKYLLGLNMIK
tara:strand:+ start:300 stop:779 length:480 start_codon:yes stop_codon:yes gene_type:complete